MSRTSNAWAPVYGRYEKSRSDPTHNLTYRSVLAAIGNRLIHNVSVTSKIFKSAFGNWIIVVSHAEVNELESSVQ